MVWEGDGMVWEGDGMVQEGDGMVQEVMEGCGKLMELCGKSGGGSTFFCFILVQCSPVAYLRALDQKKFWVSQELLSLIEWSTRSQKMYFFLVQCPTLGYHKAPDQNIFIHCFGPVVVDLKPLNYLPWGARPKKNISTQFWSSAL